MALAAGKEIASLDRIINNRQAHVEPVLFEKDTLVTRLEPGVRQDYRRPTGPNVNREFDHEFAILRALGVIADAGHRRDRGPIDQHRGIRPGEQRNVRGRIFQIFEFFLHLVHVERGSLGFSLWRDFVPPTIHSEADDTEQDDRQHNFSTCGHMSSI